MNRLKEQVNEIKRHYDFEAVEYDIHYGSRLQHAEDYLTKKLMQPHIDPSQRILDIGSGTGLFLDFFSDTVSPENYTGVDISSNMIKISSSKYPNYKFLQADMHALTDILKPSSVDRVVCMYGTFSYSPNPVLLLEQIRYVTTNDAKLVLMPYTARVKHGIFTGYTTHDYNSDIDINYYSSKLLQQLSDSGFEVVDQHGINYGVNIISPLMRIAETLISDDQNWINKIMEIDHQFFSKIRIPTNWARHMLIVSKSKAID